MDDSGSRARTWIARGFRALKPQIKYWWLIGLWPRFSIVRCTQQLLTVQRPQGGVTKRRRLSWLTNCALVIEPPNAGGGEELQLGGWQRVQLYCTHEPTKTFEDLSPYLTYERIACSRLAKDVRRPTGDPKFNWGILVGLTLPLLSLYSVNETSDVCMDKF